MKQGEVYLVDLGPVAGLELGGQQLIVVVSNDIINASSLPVVVVPALDAADSPPMRVLGVFVSASESSLSVDVVVNCLHVRSLDQGRFPNSPVGEVPASRLKDIEKALQFIFRA